MPRHSLLIARFPYLNQECPDSTDWLVRTVLKIKVDPRVSDVYHTRVDDTPITMGRNRAVQSALERKCDFLLMLDSDMAPDCEPDGAPFWDTSWEFALNHNGPCVVGAPYCGPPPHENVYVFQWANRMNDSPNPDFRLEQFTREEAVRLKGIQPVAALPTGLILIDMRAIQRLKQPWFYYEWKDERQAEKASTEDVTFTRDLSLAGVPMYCNWSAWAGHWKRHLVRKPRQLTVDQIRSTFVEAVRQDIKKEQQREQHRERILEVPRGGLHPLGCFTHSNGNAQSQGV